LRSLLVATRALARVAAQCTNHYRADLASVFPSLTSDELRSAACELEANRFTNAAIRGAAACRGWEFLPDLVDVRGGEALLDARKRGSVILVAWHAGIGAAVPAALQRLGQSGVLIRHRGGRSMLGFATLSSGGTLRERTAALIGALKHAQAGGLVILFIDTLPLGRITFDPPRVVLLDRLVWLPRGPAALRRLTEAPIFCAEASWASAAGPPFLVRFERLEPTPITSSASSGDDEGALTKDLARHFETRLRDRPGDLWPLSLRSLASAPQSSGAPLRGGA
jgi:hypothetical protein